MALTLVLSIGLNAELLSNRNFVLQSAGYFVVPAYSLKEAVEHFRGGDFDLVLLCQSLPTKEKDRLTCWIRASGSRIPVVSVSGSLCQEDAFADATVASDPNSLLNGMREALSKAELPAAWVTSPGKREAAASVGKKPPKSSIRYEQQTNITRTNRRSCTRGLSCVQGDQGKDF